jgi:hypothetical protein
MHALESVWQDTRYAGRMLRRTPAFTVAAIVILALGIGANTAIFSVLHPVLLKKVPVYEPEQLVELFSVFPGEPRRGGFAWKFYEHYRGANRVFSDLFGVLPARVELRRDGAAAGTIGGEFVTGNFFPALGIQPALGRCRRTCGCRAC